MKKYTKIFTLSLMTLGLSSCLKDDLVDDQKYGMINLEGNKIVELPNTGESFSLVLENKEATLDFVKINLAAKEVAQEDLRITLDTAGTYKQIQDYNTENESTVISFPTSAFTLPDGFVVTIPKGSRTGSLKIKFNQSSMSTSAPYAIAFRIASVDKAGYLISGNYNNSLSVLSAKNQYDGLYTYTGTVFRNTATGPDLSLGGTIKAGLASRPLVTLSPNTVSIVPLWADGSGIAGIDNTILTVDPLTNLVNVTSSNATLKNIPGEVNKYDPATKTFTLAFQWGTEPLLRSVRATMKYVDSRP